MPLYAQVFGDNRLFSLYIYNEEIDKIKRTGVSTCMNISHSQHCEQRHLNKDLYVVLGTSLSSVHIYCLINNITVYISHVISALNISI